MNKDENKIVVCKDCRFLKKGNYVEVDLSDDKKYGWGCIVEYPPVMLEPQDKNKNNDCTFFRPKRFKFFR